MKKHLASMVCASVVLGATSLAFAGAYGEKPQNEEMPAPVAVAPVAQPEPETAYWYVGGGAVFSPQSFEFPHHDNGWGYNVRAGYRFCDMFAAEAEWEHVPGGFRTNKVRGFDADTFAATANGKFYPITGQFQPFALVGIGYEHAAVDGPPGVGGPDKGGFAARFGLGLDVLITDNFGVAAEVDYLLPTGDIKDFDQIPIGLGVFYNFL